jgi:ATP-dependent DNA helicase RecQ
MVPNLASELGNRLGLPVHPVLTKVRRTQPQKLMENSQQQLANIYGAFAINGAVPQAPLLLIDDIADSRWTLTYAGSLLRAAGSGPVFPATLARSRG